MEAISRRRFLKCTGTFAAAGAAAAVLPRWAWANPLGLPIGIQLYTVGADMQKDAPGTVKQIAAIGYKEVETAGFGSVKTAAALRKLFDENGLKCPSAHLQFDLANLQPTFDDANTLGCQYATASVARMMIMPKMNLTANMTAAQRRAAMGDIMKPMNLDDLKKLADVMNTVGAAAKKSGLLFASHNHTEQFASIEGKTGLDYLITHTDPATVKFEIDCGWMTVAGFKPGDFVKRYPGRVKMLHVKDFLAFKTGAEPGGPDSPKGSEIGKGVVNYKEIFAEVKGHGIQHIFVEQEGPYSRMPAMQSAKVDYDYLHSLS
ncbi:MAG: sugar phosphate isomerase/epimerase [Granulicella sp.]